MIEWKGIFANTPYSSANNKTQDDAVVGMQDTIYVTGPGYGGYSANVRVHNESGAVVALIPVSGGGGALSAPAPVRILDDSTTYSYSLEVVRGAIPSNDADKIIIRIVGGASKRYPGQGPTLPDGSTSFAGLVRAPNVPAYPVVTTPRTVLQRMRGDGVRISIHGSSTMANGSTYQLLGEAVGDRKICTNSLIWALNAEGAEIDEVWNGAFSGDKTASIETKFDADWNRTVGGVVLRDAWDVEFFAPAFNNLTDPTDDLVSAKASIVRMLRKMVRHGKRVVWIMPFAGNPLSSTGATHARYQAYQAWMYATIEAEHGYRGQIIPWDLYEIFCSGGVDTPMQYLEGQIVAIPFAQHLTNIGVTYAARHPLSRDLIQSLQIPRTAGAEIYGSNYVAAMDMTTVTAGANLTIASAGNDPDTGEPMYDITSAGVLSQALTDAITVDGAKVYRIVGEYELIAKRTVNGNDYVDGVKWEDPVAQRIGIWPWINGQSIPYSDRELGRVKVFGAKWTPNDTSGSIRLFPGPPGAVVRVRGNTPIRLYEVPA